MPEFDIVGRRKIWYAISLLVIIPGIFCMFLKGFNFGIDFTGGTIIELRFDAPVGIQNVREVMKAYDLDNSTIQLSGEAADVTEARDVMIRTVDIDETERKAVMASLKDTLGNYTVLREEKVGATMGAELLLNALWATLLSWVLIVGYVSFRFEFKFGLAAVLALVHDVLVVLAAFSFTQRQLDSSFVAALLTIVGYSINDTIVIFDRIRENLKLHFRRHCQVGEPQHISNADTINLYRLHCIVHHVRPILVRRRYHKRFLFCSLSRIFERLLFFYFHCQPSLGDLAPDGRPPKSASCRGGKNGAVKTA